MGIYGVDLVFIFRVYECICDYGNSFYINSSFVGVIMPQLENKKHELFCLEYLSNGLNATQAYKDVYKNKCTENVAWASASRILSNVKVHQRIQELYSDKAEKIEVTVEWVLEQMKLIASSNASDAFRDDGSLLPLKEMPLGLQLCVASFEMVEYFEGKGEDREQVGWLKKIKFWNKDKNLENLGRTLAMFVDRQQHEMPQSVEEFLRKQNEEKS